jgi:hypothetical protein
MAGHVTLTKAIEMRRFEAGYLVANPIEEVAKKPIEKAPHFPEVHAFAPRLVRQLHTDRLEDARLSL